MGRREGFEFVRLGRVVGLPRSGFAAGRVRDLGVARVFNEVQSVKALRMCKGHDAYILRISA